MEEAHVAITIENNLDKPIGAKHLHFKVRTSTWVCIESERVQEDLHLMAIIVAQKASGRAVELCSWSAVLVGENVCAIRDALMGIKLSLLPPKKFIKWCREIFVESKDLSFRILIQGECSRQSQCQSRMSHPISDYVFECFHRFRSLHVFVNITLINLGQNLQRLIHNIPQETVKSTTKRD